MAPMKFIKLLCLSIVCAHTVSGQVEIEKSRYDDIHDLIVAQHMHGSKFDSIVQQMVTDFLNDTATIHRLLKQLDPYTVYYDSAAYLDLQSMLSGTYGGLGLAFSIIDNGVYITEVFAHTPASKMGLKPGDQILQIDDFSCQAPGLDFWPVIQALRGEIGSVAHLVIYDVSWDSSSIEIVREQIVMPSIPVGIMLDNRTGYIKISSFTDKTADEFHNVLAELKKSGMEHLVIDLRDNPGGYMKQALRIADEFLVEDRLMVYTIGKNGRTDYLATSDGLFEEGEVDVLVNAITASSGEILTAALQGNKRATIYGTRTFGKGLVQKIYPFRDSTEAVKVTTETYYTPTGVCIQQPLAAGNYAFTRSNEEITDKGNGATSNISELVPDWGISPDVTVLEPTAPGSALFNGLLEREYILQAATLYLRDNYASMMKQFDSQSFIQEYEMPDSVLLYIEQLISDWEQSPNKYFPDLPFTHTEFLEASDFIRQYFTATLAKMLFGETTYYHVFLRHDPVMQAVMRN